MTKECAKNHFPLMEDSRSESLDVSVCGLVSMYSFSLYGRPELSIKNAISIRGILMIGCSLTLLTVSNQL